MQRYLTIGALITAAVCLVGMWYAMNQALSAREQVGWEKAVKTQYATDNTALIIQTQTIVDAFAANSRMMNEIRIAPDPSSAPQSIVSTISRLCDERKAHGLPCGPSPSPTRKPVQ